MKQNKNNNNDEKSLGQRFRVEEKQMTKIKEVEQRKNNES